MARRVLNAVVGTIVLAAVLPSAAIAGGAGKCSTVYGQAWIASSLSSSPPSDDWPTGILRPSYTLAPGVFLLRGDGGWYKNGATRRDSITVQWNTGSGCNYDFSFGLSSSSRAMYLTPLSLAVPPHTYLNLDPLLFSVDRMGSVPLTNPSNPAFQAFCTGPDSSYLLLNTGYPLVIGRDGYADPPEAQVDGQKVVFDNYGGCGVDPLGHYYVRRGMVVRANAPNGGPIIAIRFNEMQNTVNPCDQFCRTTSYVRVYHPDSATWVIAPEDTSGVMGAWAADYEEGTGDKSWAHKDFVQLPFMVAVKPLP